MLHINRVIALAFFLYQLSKDLINLELSLSFSIKITFVFFDKDVKIHRSDLLNLIRGSSFFSSLLTIFYQFFDTNSNFITIFHGQ